MNITQWFLCTSLKIDVYNVYFHSSDVKIENPMHLLALDGVVLIFPPSIFRLHSQSPIWCYVGSWSPHPNWKPCCARFRDLYICQMSGSGLKLNAESFPLIIIKKRLHQPTIIYKWVREETTIEGVRSPPTQFVISGECISSIFWEV